MAFRRPGRRAPVEPEKAAASGAIFGAATALLRARDHAGAELAGKLRAKGFDPEPIAAVIAELRELGLINDARFAESFVRSHADRGQGPVRISGELRQRGLSQELIES